MRERALSIVGAGLAGALLAILLARRGLRITLYERRSDPRLQAPQGGRSINLALAARGMRALDQAGLMPHIEPLLIEMRGRMVHELGRAPLLQPYGQRSDEVIHSVGRAALNRLLIEEAARHEGVTLRFEHSCEGVRPDGDRLLLRDATGRSLEVPLTPTLATDGAGSSVRTALAKHGLVTEREDPLDHDYKELRIAPVPSASHRQAHGTDFALEPHALHVWPRQGFMLIALPNTDRSFTATLFLPREGSPSFAALADARAVQALFAEQFADAAALVPDLTGQFAKNPQGRLGTLHCRPWHLRGQVLLLGDAAHAIVPFHGQGMNAAFEDCLLLDRLLEEYANWSELFAAFDQARRADAEAIARMAIENYGEMRERVLDPRFVRLSGWARELERRHPQRFIPRYAMVMFHPEIGYADALRRGAIQRQILDELDRQAAGGSRFDDTLADVLVRERL